MPSLATTNPHLLLLLCRAFIPSFFASLACAVLNARTTRARTHARTHAHTHERVATQALTALEYNPAPEDEEEYKQQQMKSTNGNKAKKTKGGGNDAAERTPGFWRRVEALFKTIDNGGDGDGKISRAELVKHFKVSDG